MTTLSIFSIIISVIALLVSLASYFLNVAKHNLQQLQTRYQIFCDKFQALLNFGSQQQLTGFKYDLENVVILDPHDSQCSIAYNNLQKTTTENKDACKLAYAELSESFDFLETKNSLNIKRVENDFVKWFNETINLYYSKLSHFYVTLFEINFITKIAQSGELLPDAIDTIRDLYKTVRDITDIREVLLLLKREMTGVFGQLSVRDIGFFSDNIKAIKKIEKYINIYIDKFGLKNVIENKDYSKISVVYKGFDESCLSYLVEEEEDFILFIQTLKEMSQKNAPPRH